MQKLTESAVTRLTVDKGEREAFLWDGSLPGFGVRAFASGAKSFVVKYALADGRQRRMSLGAAQTGMLGETRKAAASILLKVRNGQDPAGDKKASREREQKQKLVGELMRDYLAVKDTQVRPTTYRLIERHLMHVFRSLHDRPIETLSRRDVVEIVDAMVKQGHPVQADRSKTTMVGFCSWCMEYGYLAGNIAVGIKQRTAAEHAKRDRVLSMKELAQVWAATSGEDDFSKLTRLLILTGARRQELGKLEWNEIDIDQREISLPKERTKPGVAHTIYLSDAALAILQAIVPRPRKKHVFGQTVGSGFSGWSKAKLKLDKRLGDSIRPWRHHDLRRSLCTNASNLGLAPMVVLEAALGHWGAAKPGVVGVYDHFKHDPERRKLMDDWAAAVLAHAEK